MQLHCPLCDARLAVRIGANGDAECLACGQRFPLKDAHVADTGVRSLTAPKTLREQLDKLAKNVGEAGSKSAQHFRSRSDSSDVAAVDKMRAKLDRLNRDAELLGEAMKQKQKRP